MPDNKTLIEEVANDLRVIALANPKLAFMLTRGKPLEKRVYTLDLQWDTAAANQPIRDLRLDDKMFQMFWIHDITYTLRRPNFAPGVFWNRQQDEYAKRNPYVDVAVNVVGPGNRELTRGLTPIENFCSTTSSGHFRNELWVLTENQNISVDAVNTRAFGDGETPYLIQMSFSGLELSGCELPGTPWDDVVCRLREEGIYPQPSGRR